MKCPFCGAEIEDGLSLCPLCRKVLTQEAAEDTAEAAEVVETAEEAVESTEKALPIAEIALEGGKKKSRAPVIISIVLCAVAACAIVLAIIFSSQIAAFFRGMFSGEKATPAADTGETTSATETERESSKPRDPSEAVEFTSDVLSSRDVYSVKDITSSDDPRLSTVVAYCGDIEFTNADLQLLYRNAYFQFMNQYGAYAQMFGLDTTLPLWEQYAAEGVTWEQEFLSEGLNYAKEFGAVKQYCIDNGIELSKDLQEYIDTMPEDLEASAITYGFASAEEYVQDTYGVAVTVPVFMQYFECMAFEEEIYNSLTCTEDEVIAFYENNPDVMTSYGISKQTVDVRHILIKPADADGDEVSTDEEWQAASDEAERIYALYLENPTEENYIELAKQYNQDPGSQETDGLYEGVMPGQMVAEFNDWIFADGRKNGDVEIVKTSYGYHIMFFVSIQENADWYEQCEAICLNEKMTAKLAEITENYPLMIFVDDIIIDDVQQLDAADAG